MNRSLLLRTAIVFVAHAGTLLLAGTSAAVAQVGYTGLPSSPPSETYVGTYVGPPSAVGTVVGAGGAPRAASVANTQPDAAEVTEPGERSVVTGWDLVTIAALGMAAVVGFAVSAGRFRLF
jgi:hypothetical protein